MSLINYFAILLDQVIVFLRSLKITQQYIGSIN